MLAPISANSFLLTLHSSSLQLHILSFCVCDPLNVRSWWCPHLPFLFSACVTALSVTSRWSPYFFFQFVFLFHYSFFFSKLFSLLFQFFSFLSFLILHAWPLESDILMMAISFLKKFLSFSPKLLWVERKILLKVFFYSFFPVQNQDKEFLQSLPNPVVFKVLC